MLPLLSYPALTVADGEKGETLHHPCVCVRSLILVKLIFRLIVRTTIKKLLRGIVAVCGISKTNVLFNLHLIINTKY